MPKFATHLLTILFSAVASGAALAAPAAQQVAPTLTPQAAVVAYCAAWNATERAERQRLLAQVWAPDGVYDDPEPTHAVGRDGLSDAISVFHHGYPGARFRCSAPQVHHGAMRVTWILLRPDGSEVTHGTDFSELAADGRIRRVVGFFGEPPVIGP